MKVLRFATQALPPEHRLPAFRQGAFEFHVDAIGDPLAFDVAWELLRLGEVEVVRTRASPMHYRRDATMIDPDHQHRVTIHFHLEGGGTGTIDGQAVRGVSGDAQAWDLARPLDMRSDAPTRLLIVNLPRHLLQEVLPLPRYVASVPPGPAVAFAIDQIGTLLDHAEELPEASAPALGRAVRDLAVAALLPGWLAAHAAPAPLAAQIVDLIDRAPRRRWSEALLADALGVDTESAAEQIARLGGLGPLLERRRLLLAYRLLCDPAEEAAVSGIAHRCGFDDMPQFSRRFRAVFDRSPSDVRRNQRGVLPRWAGSYMVEQHYAAMRAP